MCEEDVKILKKGGGTDRKERLRLKWNMELKSDGVNASRSYGTTSTSLPIQLIYRRT